MTRPEIPIDWKLVDELLESGCPGTDIAATFGMHCETFYDRVKKKYNIGFTEYAQKKKLRGDSILRHAQFLKATGKTKKGDNTLLIWLGKQRLGQKENLSDSIVSPELLAPLAKVMNQLTDFQQERNKDSINNKSE